MEKPFFTLEPAFDRRDTREEALRPDAIFVQSESNEQFHLGCSEPAVLQKVEWENHGRDPRSLPGNERGWFIIIDDCNVSQRYH